MLFDLFSAISAGNAVSAVIIVFSYLVILLVAFPIHECAHGFVAKLLGDSTAEEQGRISLMPFSHIDPMGTIGLLVFGIGWAKSTPINPRRARKVSQKTALALTAAAGPVANLLFSLVFMIAAKIILVTTGAETATTYYLVQAFNTVININLGLTVFNLLPIPPFDGSRIIFAFLPTKYYFSIMRYERYIMIGILVLLWTGILSIPMAILENLLYSGLDFITSFIC